VPDPASRTADLGDQARQILNAADGDITAAAASAARLVQRAGSILEEELSVGITALDRLENRFVDVDRMRDPETHELLNRFRTDAHQIVDLVLDIVGTSFDTVGRIADGGVSIGVPLGRTADDKAARRPASGGSTGSVSVLDASETVAAGETARLSMSVNNSADSATEPFSLVASDLVSNEGARIPSDSVTFEPLSVTIPANASERVEIVVAVPADVAPGTYAGLVQATNLGPVRAVLTLAVT
jgi:hypothetical protein